MTLRVGSLWRVYRPETWLWEASHAFVLGRVVGLLGYRQETREAMQRGSTAPALGPPGCRDPLVLYVCLGVLWWWPDGAACPVGLVWPVADEAGIWTPSSPTLASVASQALLSS